MRRLMVEQLESRQLLSGGPVGYFSQGGQLTINGSDGPDRIALHLQRDPGTSNATVEVTIGYGKNAVTKTFGGVSSCGVNANGGNDRIQASGTGLSDAQGPVVYLNGDDGNDTIKIVNFDGYVFADGGNGNDFIDASRAFGQFAFVGSFNFRFLQGGNGNDRILGSSASDQLYGDAGNDVLKAGAGNDVLNGGSGINVLSGGAGDDAFYVLALSGTYPQAVEQGNVGGYDKMLGGAGYDTIYGFFNSSMEDIGFGFQDTISVEGMVLIDVNSGAG